MRESRFRPDAGIVTVRTTGGKADSEAGRIVIMTFERTILTPKRG